MIDIRRAPAPRSAVEPPSAPAYPDVRFLDVLPRRIFAIRGAGLPEQGPAFRQAMETLYPVAYTLHFTLKRRGVQAPVGLLEATWEPEGDAEPDTPGPTWTWTAMIRVPDEATDEEIVGAIGEVRERRSPPALDRLAVMTVDEGLSAEIVHVGPYGSEAASIARLEAAIAESGRIVRGPHHEIYVSDPNRTAPDRLKTIIRLPIT